MTTEARPDAYVREIRIEARPETVFGYLVDPELMVQWMGRSVDVDPKPGGVYCVDIDGDRHIARGEFVDVTPHERVVFTWGWESEESPVRPGSSTVEMTLEPDGEATILRLVHRDLPTAKSIEGHANGWEHYLARLATAAGGGDPGPDHGPG